MALACGCTRVAGPRAKEGGMPLGCGCLEAGVRLRGRGRQLRFAFAFLCLREIEVQDRRAGLGWLVLAAWAAGAV